MTPADAARRRARRRLRCAVAATAFALPVLAFGGSGVGLGLWLSGHGGARGHAVALLVLGGLVTWGCLLVLFEWWRITLRPSVVPSFRPKFDRWKYWTPEAARRIAGRIEALDVLAGALGLCAPSAFGVDERGWGEGRSWFPARAGLRTIRGLREHLAGRADRDVVGDLELLEEALSRAARENGMFRFNLR